MAAQNMTFAQNPTCGTQPQQESISSSEVDFRQKQFERSFLEQLQNGQSQNVLYYPIRFIVISPIDSSYVPAELIPARLQRTNVLFEPAGVQFYQCEPTSYILNSNLPSVLDLSTFMDSPIYNQYHQEGMVEVWITYQIDGVFLGLTFRSYNDSPILLSMPGIVDENILAHELGHYFSLPHTHGNALTGGIQELVNGSNCTQSGDFFCDTPADPNLSGLTSVDPNCLYIDTTNKDTNGEIYKPFTNNIMSYSPSGCQTTFTPMQLAEIAWVARIVGPNKTGCTDWNYAPQAEGVTVSSSLPFSVQFHANSPNSDSFAWDFNEDGLIDSYDANPIYTYTKSGSYDVKLTLSKNGQSFDWIQQDMITVGGMNYPFFENFGRFYQGNKNYDLSGGWQFDEEALVGTQLIKSAWLPCTIVEPIIPLGPLTDHTNEGDRGALCSRFLINQELDTNFLLMPTISIPQNIPSAYLSLWYHIFSQGEGEVHFDLHDGSTWIPDIVPALIGSQQSSTAEPYKQLAIDVSPFKGKQIQLRLRSNEINNSGINNWIAIVLDDFLVWNYPSISIAKLQKKTINIQEEGGETNGCKIVSQVKIPIVLSNPVQIDTCYIHANFSGSAEIGSDFSVPYTSLILPPGTQDTLWFLIDIYDDDSAEGDEEILLHLSSSGNGDLWLQDTLVTISISENDSNWNIPSTQYGATTVLTEDFENGLVKWELVNRINQPGSKWNTGTYASWVNNNNFNNQLISSWGIVGNPTNKFAYPLLPTTSAHGYKDIMIASPFFKLNEFERMDIDFSSFISPYGGAKHTIDYQYQNSDTWIEIAKINSCKVWTRKQVKFNTLNLSNDSIRIAFRYRGTSNRDDWWLDDVKIIGQGLTLIDTALNHSTSAYLAPYSHVHFFSDQDSTLIASVENVSNHNFGCVEAHIEHSGKGALHFSGGTLLEKSVRFSTSNPNPNAAVQITLYYHQEEIAGWEAESGFSKNILKALTSEAPISQNIGTYKWLSGGSLSPYSMEGHQRFAVESQGLTGSYALGTDMLVSENNVPTNQPTWYIFPNPTNGSITLKNTDATLGGESRYRIFSLQGKLLKEANFWTSEVQIEVPNSGDGFYFFEVQHAEGMQTIRVEVLRR